MTRTKSFYKGRRNTSLHRNLKRIPVAGAVGLTAARHKHGHALGRALQTQRRGIAHLVEGLRLVKCPHQVLPGVVSLPQLKYQLSAWRCVVPASVD